MFKMINGKWVFVQEAAGDDGADGGGGSGDSQAAAAKAAADAAAAAAAAEAAKGDKGADGMTAKERELLHEVMEKKTKLKEAADKVKDFESKLKVWEGLDPAEVKALIAAQKDAKTKELEAKGEYEAVKQQMREAHEAEKKTLAERIADLETQLRGRDTQIDGLTVGQTFSQSKFIAEKLTLSPTKTRTIYGDHFDRDETGRVVGYDKPRGAAGRAPLVNGNGEPLSFDDALAKLVEADPDKETVLRATTRPGASSGTNNGLPNPQPKVAGGISRITAGLNDGKLVSAGRRLLK